MAEQFLRAYSINVKDLYDVVASNNNAIIKSAMKNKDQAEEVNELIEEWGESTKDGLPFGLEQALDDIIKGNLDKKRVYEYTRTLELLLEVKGKLLKDEVTFPGRGWQDIGKYFSNLGLPTLGKTWCKVSLSFPWREEDKLTQPDWPISTVIKQENVSKLKQELEKFDIAILKKHSLPKRQMGLEEEIGTFIKMLKKWLKNSDKDVVLLLDGQQ